MQVKVPIDPVRITELMYLAKTIFAEARSEGYKGMFLVGCVIRNRVEHPSWPDTYASVCTQPRQFSAWLRDDPNYTKIADPLSGGPADDAAWYDAIRAADAVMDLPRIENPLPGVYHYVDVRLKDKLPKWAQGMEQITLPDAPRIIFLRSR